MEAPVRPYNLKSIMPAQLLFLLWALLLFSFSGHGQSKDSTVGDDETAMQKASLLSDLQILQARAKRLNKPLARAAAEAEIGDAAWAQDRDWAKGLLREAYELTLPDEEQR